MGVYARARATPKSVNKDNKVLSSPRGALWEHSNSKMAASRRLAKVKVSVRFRLGF